MQYWGGIAPPTGLSKRMISCRSNNPNLGYKLISSAGAAKRLNRWFGSDVANGFLSIRMEAMRSDVFRVAWVLRKGGYYVDAASEVLSSFVGAKIVMELTSSPICSSTPAAEKKSET